MDLDNNACWVHVGADDHDEDDDTDDDNDRKATDTVSKLHKGLEIAEREKLEAATEEITKLKTQMAELRASLEEAETSRVILELELVQTKRDVAEQKYTIADREETDNDMKQKLTDDGDEIKRTEEELHHSRDHLEETEREITLKDIELSTNSSEHKALQAEKEISDEEHKAKQAEKAISEDEHKAKQAEKAISEDEHKALPAEKGISEEEHKAKQAEKAISEDEHKALQAEKELLDGKHKALQAEKELLDGLVQQQESVIFELNEKLQDLKTPPPSPTCMLDAKVLHSAHHEQPVHACDSSANSEPWSCAACTFLNDPDFETCEICCRSRIDMATSLIHQDPPPLATKVRQPVLHEQPVNVCGSGTNSVPWSCPKCTFINDPALETCEVCERPRKDVLTSSPLIHQDAVYVSRPDSDAESNTACRDEDSQSDGSCQDEDEDSSELCRDEDKQRACYPELADFKARFASFWNMPETMTQSAQSLAKAGLFYEGDVDTYRCFYCGGDLHNWNPNDDPWILHARHYPDCGFVKQEKSQLCIDHCDQLYSNSVHKFEVKNTVSSSVDLSDNALCSAPPSYRDESGTAERSEDYEDAVKSAPAAFRNQSFPKEQRKDYEDTTYSAPPEYSSQSFPQVPRRHYEDNTYSAPPEYRNQSVPALQRRHHSDDPRFSKPPAYMTDSEDNTEFGPSAYRNQSVPYVPSKGSKGPVLFFGRDILSQMIYEKALKEGTETDETIRLMVIGCHGQGKTSLVRRLLGEDVDDVSSTNGIDICRCITGEDGTHWTRQLSENAENESIKRIASVVKKTVPASINFVSAASSKDKFEDKLAKQLEDLNSTSAVAPIECLNVWDFGGQFVYYATHQLFHSRKAVYLLVFNLCADLNARVEDEDFLMQKDEKTMGDYIEFWLNSIHSFVGNEEGREPAVILVGTHADQLQNMQEADKYFEAVRDLFSERKLGMHIQEEQFAISTTVPSADEIQRLRETIISIGKKQKEGEKIPAKWIPLERTLKDRRNENIISIEEVLQIDKKNDYPIGNEEEIKSFLEFQHISGTFFYFNEGEMSHHVVVNPLFLIHAFRCIITSKRFCSQNPKLRTLWQTLKEKAILEPKLLYSVWQNESEEFIKFQEVLISYLKKHRIIGETQQIDMTADNASTKPLGSFIVPSLLRKSDNGSVKDFLEGKLHTPVSLVYEFENEAVVPAIFQRVTAAAIGTWSILHFKGKPLLFEDVSVYKISLSHAGMLLRANNRIEILVVNLCLGRGVAEEMTNYFRRFTEVMIGAEFQKLRPLEPDITVPVKESFRCFHEKHDGKGSVITYQREFLQNVKEVMICCPDHVTHDNLNSRAILGLWFNNRIAAKQIPRKQLTDREYSILSTNCVGYGWQQLAYHLGIPEKKVEQIDMDNKEVSLKVFKVFKTWDMMNAENSTLDTLVDLIQHLPRNIISLDALNNLIDKFY